MFTFIMPGLAAAMIAAIATTIITGSFIAALVAYMAAGSITMVVVIMIMLIMPTNHKTAPD